MRDEVVLATTVVLPSDSAPPTQGDSFPVVLLRTPYNRIPYASGAPEFARRGYAFVVQDCRGRYGSQGEFIPWLSEENDGLDTLDWIASQSWCNGRVGMYGDSYLGGAHYP